MCGRNITFLVLDSKKLGNLKAPPRTRRGKLEMQR